MPTSQARIITPSASKYLQQLCKHWSHKFEVEFTPQHGRVPFAHDRAATFDATAEALTLRVEAADDIALARMEGVVIEHLKRFAFREELGAVDWTRSA